MRTKLRSKISLLFMTCALLVAVPAVAFAADAIFTDGDLVTTGDQLSRNLGTLAPGATFTADPSATPPVPASDVKFYLDCNGQNHFNSTETADLNVSATSKKDAAGNTITGGSVAATSLSDISGPASWPADSSGGSACNTFANAELGTSNVTIVAPKKAGSYTYTVTYTLNRDSGSTDATTTANNELALDGTQSANSDSVTATFTFSVNNVAPVINSFQVSATDNGTSATEGQTKTYTISASDANEDSLTYGLTKDSGTANVNITDNGGGSFAVEFLTPGSLVLKASASDGVNAAVTQNKTVTVAPANTAPQASGQSVSTNEDIAKTITLSGSDADGDNLSFSITDTPDQGSLGTISSPVCSATTKTCTADVTYTPAANYFGSDSFAFKVNDGKVDSATAATVSITVNSVNDAPSFSLPTSPNQTVLEDSGAQSVSSFATNFSAGPSNESGQALLNYVVSNDNNGLFSSQPAIDNTGKLTYTPAANKFGTATVTVRAQDNGGTANGGVDLSTAQTFTITVTGVNDAPSFDLPASPNQTVLEDSGAQNVSGFATNISAGPNESQTVSFVVTNDNNGLFSSQPAINATTGALTYTPAANANGSAIITVKATDNGGTANGGDDESDTQTFTISVTAVNDAPSFDLLLANPNQTVLANATGSVSGFAGNFSAGPSNESGQALLGYVVTVTNTNNTNLFSEQPAIDNTGQLTYKLAQDAVGTATVSVKVQDNGGTANGGEDLSTAKTFTIDVNYGFSGFLQPINMTAHQTGTDVSTFKAGSTIPVKFQLKDANGAIIQPASAPVWVTPLKGSATNQAVDEDLYSLAATSGGFYRYDATAQQWIYNWSTKGLTSGFYYRIGVTLPDGNTYYQNISLR
jgi:large repetitive protein